MSRANNTSGPSSAPAEPLGAMANPFSSLAGDESAHEEPDTADSEERTVRSRAPEMRGDRGFNEDHERMGEAFDDFDEFQRQLENEFEDERLPAPPKIPGYHTCWLTSNSSSDPIAKRQRLGYMPVRQDELPAFRPSNGQALTSFEGVITCNEMVLHKIEERRYQAFMGHYHHKRPLQDEGAQLQKIKDGNENVGTDRDGKSLGNVEGDGISTLERSYQRGRAMRPPTFS